MKCFARYRSRLGPIRWGTEIFRSLPLASRSNTLGYGNISLVTARV